MFKGSVVVVVVLGVSLVAERAQACGPDFPAQLLRDRRGTMMTLVDGSFDHDMLHLVPAPQHPLRVVENEWRRGNEHEPDGARSQGRSLERALYDDGAMAFHAGDAVAAEGAWQRLLALEPAERRHRSTWAAFMLGRVTHEARFFRQTRALAIEGYYDALGLAVASYGEEARLALDDGRIAEAVRLYAEQAALGSEVGRTSLLFVARRLVNDDKELERAARDPIVRKLVSSYLYARSNELEGAWDGAHLAKVERLVRVLKKQRERHARSSNDDGVDRLAAVAYRAGQFALARELSQLSDAPVSTWVKAKLALRDGRLDDAAALLALASAAFPADVEWGERSDISGDWERLAPRARIDGERAVLELEGREYAAALTHLLAPGDRYWRDAAYVAERVLSLDELVAYVKANAPRAVPVVANEWGGTWPSVQNDLRELLARRLMRAGRFAEALGYFDDGGRRALAKAYGELVVRGGDVGLPREQRARALYDASLIARRDGMHVIGFELDPDWEVFDGGFDLGDLWWDDDGRENDVRGDVMVPGAAFSSYDEQLRVASTVAVPLKRFHYREIAANLAVDAASLMPPRSQAYAASLCQASKYVIDQNWERGQDIWFRYVENGAYVDFATTFGRDCPAPDFDAAVRRYDDADQLRPEYRDPPRHAPLRKRDAARDAAILVAFALATHIAARGLTRRGRGASASTSP